MRLLPTHRRGSNQQSFDRGVPKLSASVLPVVLREHLGEVELREQSQE